jgi:hypothetical protein
MTDARLPALRGVVDTRFGQLRKPLRTNLAVVTVAFLPVRGSARSGYGRVSLLALARALPTPGSPHSREKRLHRFLAHPRLDFRTMTTALAPLVLAARPSWCPILLDQTQSGPAATLVAAVPYAGRALPLALYTFATPLQEPPLKSQNQLEHVFLLDVETALPTGVIGVWIADRGYARSLLLLQSEREGRAYIIRGRTNTIITWGQRRMKLGQLPAPPGRAVRYEGIRYHAARQVLLDVVVYHERAFQEPWYLLVPVGARSFLSAEQVVACYRDRMQIEQSFRDFKTHLGLRGLPLQVEVAARMGRLLMAFCLAYILGVLLGDSPLGQRARQAFEIPRRHPRHGTTRTLSALTLAMLMLSHPAWLRRSLAALVALLARAEHDQPLLRAPSYLIPFQRAP